MIVSFLVGIIFAWPEPEDFHGVAGSSHDAPGGVAGEERGLATSGESRSARRMEVGAMAAQMTQMPTTPKGRRTRSRLLASARTVLARNGYVALKMIDVAEEAGVSLGALYRYFRNKEDLFRALVDGIHEALFEASRAPHKQLANDPRGEPCWKPTAATCRSTARTVT